MRRHSAGFSLLELAVATAVTGLIGVSLWKLIPAGTALVGGNTAQQQLAQSQETIEGFVVLNNRLPCPAIDDAGSEACGTATIGQLPWRTLGLPRPDPMLRYGVYRSATDDLAVRTARLARNLPPDLIAPAVSFAASRINGLDFCVALRSAAANPSSLTAGGVPVAYVLAHPGGNRTFEGLNTTTTFALPGTPQASNFDDRNLATGLGELSTRLGCVTRLAAAHASARSAFVAFDLDRNAQTFLDFRDFAYEVRKTNTRNASAVVGFATLNVLIATASSVSAVSLTVNSGGAAAVVTGLSAASLLAAVGSLAGATLSLVNATSAEETARLQWVGAGKLKVASVVDFANAVAVATSVNAKGLLP